MLLSFISSKSLSQVSGISLHYRCDWFCNDSQKYTNTYISMMRYLILH